MNIIIYPSDVLFQGFSFTSSAMHSPPTCAAVFCRLSITPGENDIIDKKEAVAESGHQGYFTFESIAIIYLEENPAHKYLGEKNWAGVVGDKLQFSCGAQNYRLIYLTLK